MASKILNRHRFRLGGFAAVAERLAWQSRGSVWGLAVWHVRILKINPHDRREPEGKRRVQP